MSEPRDTGDQLAVSPEEQLDVDPDPAEVGEQNEDAFTESYDLEEGEDVELGGEPE